jgi:ArsR family transcriptional regulator
MMRRLEGDGDALAEALLRAAIGVSAGRRAPASVGRLLDIGTGTGRVLELLGPHARAAVGVDRSPEMLRLARSKLSTAGLEGVEVRQSDLRALPFADGMFDTVVIQHVLHFTDDPAAAVAEAARVTASGGALFIVDYAPHGREELRQRLRHVRLGFEPSAVLGWMEMAGLRAVVSAEAAGPGLTSLLWEGRRP